MRHDAAFEWEQDEATGQAQVGTDWEPRAIAAPDWRVTLALIAAVAATFAYVSLGCMGM